jgi:two-component system cell cycle response regulator DivK
MQAAKVLLIEGHEDSQYVYSMALRHWGFSVLETADGEAGMALAREHRPDIIVADLEIGGAEGVPVLELLCADHLTKNIPVIALTFYATPLQEQQAAAAGCFRLVQKPCLPRELHKLIVAALS